MDAYDATRIVLSRIQTFDPENASKIMSFLLLHDHGKDNEMIRLAFGPESLLHSLVLKARKELALPPSPSPSSTLANNLPSLSSWSASSKPMNSSASPFYGRRAADLVDELQLQDQLSYLSDGPKSPDFLYPQTDLASWGAATNGVSHRRSCSVSDVSFGSDDSTAGGLGWKPCVYYARGYCKNGNSCTFLHGGFSESGGVSVGSPSKLEMIEPCQEHLLRSRSAAAASQLMAASTFPKSMNLLLQQQQIDSQRAAAAAAMLTGEDLQKFGLTRFERSMLSINPGSRQIYLTFPADSTFREEDVSNYFSNYGPVQDVRIPYQQKRMFGFVTFVYPDTVKRILAKGNPHFVCDARVLVKPYKEKGKVPDKYRKQQLERADLSACGSPTGLDSRDPYDLQLRFSTQEMLWRKKLEEQADLREAIELHGRRLMGLRLLDVKRHSHHRMLSTDAAIASPTHSPNFFNQSLAFHPDSSSPKVNPVDQQRELAAIMSEKEKETSILNGTSGNAKESAGQHERSDSQPESCLEHNLPDSPFASPKAAGDFPTAFSNGEAEKNALLLATSSSLLPTSSALDMASLKSCYFPVPSHKQWGQPASQCG
ncbi:zinc finger CCCH domain-containing protein 53-like isoform X2 [Diospyros lotus]|uniref:zinc finger CCCH domain-containing protein 53-like isoform X2 n=1 Tax=Diospyros lotus TaxID=55363 RepID=UPI00225B719F|nr:zinc finger CCCH domain-containing protein 53-like isoform X2 [Diospyros lotus]